MSLEALMYAYPAHPAIRKFVLKTQRALVALYKGNSDRAYRDFAVRVAMDIRKLAAEIES